MPSHLKIRMLILERALNQLNLKATSVGSFIFFGAREPSEVKHICIIPYFRGFFLLHIPNSHVLLHIFQHHDLESIRPRNGLGCLLHVCDKNAMFIEAPKSLSSNDDHHLLNP